MHLLCHGPTNLFLERAYISLMLITTRKKKEKLIASLLPELSIPVFSFLCTIIGSILVIVSLAVLDHASSNKVGSVVCFLIGCTIMMMAYNIQAAFLPSLYTKTLPSELRIALTPWYGAMVALGKLAAPPHCRSNRYVFEHSWRLDWLSRILHCAYSDWCNCIVRFSSAHH